MLQKLLRRVCAKQNKHTALGVLQNILRRVCAKQDKHTAFPIGLRQLCGTASLKAQCATCAPILVHPSALGVLH